MPRRQRIKKRFVLALMVGTVLSVVGYGTAIAANVAHMPAGDPENPDASPSPTPGYTLVVHVDGDGDVTSKPAGINCGDKHQCQDQFDSKVTLVAHPAPNHRFVSWNGACTGHTTCVVRMSQARHVHAQFALVTHLLVVSRTGLGTVSSGGAGVSCPGSCSHAFTHGKTVQLVAHPHAGWHLASWSGACSGHRSCTVRMNAAHRVVAHFRHG
jgi:Divergent InlB B-repeat domain